MAELSPLSAIALTITCISLGLKGEWTLCPPSVTRTGNASASDGAQSAHAICIFLQSVKGISVPLCLSFPVSGDILVFVFASQVCHAESEPESEPD